MVVEPSALQMGWNESPAFFCATTETVRDVSQMWSSQPMQWNHSWNPCYDSLAPTEHRINGRYSMSTTTSLPQQGTVLFYAGGSFAVLLCCTGFYFVNLKFNRP
jgi:hypothetical protein